MQSKLPSHVDGCQGVIQRFGIFKVRRIEMIISPGESVVGDDVGGQRYHSKVQRQNSTVLLVLRNSLAQPLSLFPNDGLE
jgi:hypothetical protein